MPQSVQEVMTLTPIVLAASETALAAARVMRDHDIGDVVVVDDADNLYGILTDRDIVVRALAEGLDPAETPLGEICSRDLTTVDTSGTVEEATALMQANALRRVPVVDTGHVVGIVSLGDLAVERDPRSVLADISAAPANS